MARGSAPVENAISSARDQRVRAADYHRRRQGLPRRSSTWHRTPKQRRTRNRPRVKPSPARSNRTGAPESAPARPARAARAALFQRQTEVTKIDRYFVLGHVGSGAMGTVFAAYDPKLDRKVALKVLSPEPPSTNGGTEPGSARETFVREARALAQVRHPNVVQVYDAGPFEDRVFLTMELVEGQTLRAWFEDDVARSWEDSLRMLVQAGRGLAAVHAAGLVHRDFKPDNVLIGGDGVARVADFGLARPDVQRATDSLETTRNAGDSHKTSAAGTPAYLAPERISGIPADARSDQFSFCVATFEGLSGKRPFSTHAILTGDYEPKRRTTLPPRLPAWLARALDRGLEPDPQARHASMDELLDALEAGLATDELGRRRRASLRQLGVGAVDRGAPRRGSLRRQPGRSECPCLELRDGRGRDRRGMAGSHPGGRGRYSGQ